MITPQTETLCKETHSAPRQTERPRYFIPCDKMLICTPLLRVRSVEFSPERFDSQMHEVRSPITGECFRLVQTASGEMEFLRESTRLEWMSWLAEDGIDEPPVPEPLQNRLLAESVLTVIARLPWADETENQ